MTTYKCAQRDCDVTADAVVTGERKIDNLPSKWQQVQLTTRGRVYNYVFCPKHEIRLEVR